MFSEFLYITLLIVLYTLLASFVGAIISTVVPLIHKELIPLKYTNFYYTFLGSVFTLIILHIIGLLFY